MPTPLFVKDAQGRYTACNAAFESALGLSREAILGRTVFDLAPADLAETYHRADLALLARGGRQVYQADMLSAPSGPRRVIFDKSLASDPATGAPLIIGLIHEHTEPVMLPDQPDAGPAALDAILGRFTARLAESPAREAAGPILALLSELGRALDSDRAFMVPLGAEGTLRPDEGQEWRREAVPPHARSLGDGALDEALPWLARRLRSGVVVDIANRATLPGEATRERARLDAAGIRAALIAPLRHGPDTLGLVGLDMATAERAWTPAEVSALRLVGHALAQAIDRARMERGLRVSERNFRAFFESMDDLIVVATPEGRILHANGAMSRALGVTVETLKDRRIRDLHPPELGDEAERVFAALLRGEAEACTLPLLGRDGRPIPVETHVWPGVWDGTPCVFGLSRDRTAEHEAHDWFERLFRTNPAPMALSTLPERVLIDVNEAFVETTGYNRVEVLGRTSQDIGLFAEPGEAERIATALATEGRVNNAELRLRRKDGQTLHGLFHAEPLVSQGRSILLSVMIDVTERKRAEQALAESEERLRLAMDAASDGIWDFDLLSGTVTWNARCYTMLGYEPDAFPVTFAIWQDLMHPDDRATSAAEVGARMLDGGAFAIEFRLRRSDGTWQWVLGRGRPVAWDADGRVIRAVGTHTDIDAMKRVEQSLVEARVAAEHANRAKSEFLASMSHELRTPLNSIIGFSSLLLSGDHPVQDPARVREYLSDIRGSGEHLLDLINDILDLSAIEAGKVVLEEGPVDLAAICETCRRLMVERAETGGVALTVELGADLPRLYADDRRVKQVLLNLMSNAVKFTPAGGRVTVRTRPAADGGLAVLVTDTGVGMDAEGVATAMRAFEQIDNVLSRRHDGIGLGLPLTARLMALHDGTLDLESEPGRGTTAVATFPVARVYPAPTPRDGTSGAGNADELLRPDI